MGCMRGNTEDGAARSSGVSETFFAVEGLNQHEAEVCLVNSRFIFAPGPDAPELYSGLCS